MKRTLRGSIALVGALAIVLSGCSSAKDTDSGPKKYETHEVTDGTTTFTVVNNPHGGTTLSFSKDGGFKLIEEKDGEYTYAFKDMNGNGKLDVWEDWRKSNEERAKDLAPQLSADQISGLMLFSSHERAPGDGLTDAQKEYLSQSYLRNVLYAAGNEIEDEVPWVNEMQAYVETLAQEGTPYVPVNFSSDPRHDATKSYNGKEGGISAWPSNLGFAATFDPSIVKKFGEYASQEYRAMGLANALSPQIDLASEPRWPRIGGTFGEDPEVAAKMAAAYVEGFQGTFDEKGKNQGWGKDSVTTVIKHFPGDGAGEGGRESHGKSGEYAVMPGDNKADHLSVFKAGVDAGAGAMMTSYSIITDKDGKPYYGNLMGSAYDQVRVDIARKDMKFDGVIVTDWGITNSVEDGSGKKFGMAWGAQDLSVEQRHFEVLKTGIDQFGGNNDIKPVQAAYQMWDEAYAKGEVPVDAKTRWAESGDRILKNLFGVGMYDNPFVDLEQSKKVMANDAAVKVGIEAQQKSVVLVKDQDKAISCEAPKDPKKMTVYIPRSYDLGMAGAFGDAKVTEAMTANEEAAKAYFGTVVTDEIVSQDESGKVTEYKAPDLSNVDMVIVGMDNPNNGSGFQNAGLDTKTGKYYPMSLQYRPYTADGENVRKVSIAGDTKADGSKENRSYYGATSKITNESVLDAFERAIAAVEASGKDIPVIVLARITTGMTIPAEFEPKADAILVGFSVSDTVLFDAALGKFETSGRLPMGMPASMDAVEKSLEDVQKDVESYKDAAGNVYEYGFGLNCSGKAIK